MNTHENFDETLEMGEKYYYGRDIKRDRQKAFEIFSRLAEQGNVVAQNYLGTMYKEGYDVPRNYSKAVEWYEKAAIQGNAEAQYNLGYMYQYDTYDMYHTDNYNDDDDDDEYEYDDEYYEYENDAYVKAAEWYEKAAKQGHVNAQSNLGFLYYLGKGIPKDYIKAVEWYEKAAEQGDEFAEISLAEMYEEGKGVPQDYVKAEEWYKKAAKQGDVDAQLHLGEMYEKGKGVTQNYVKAARWFRKAAKEEDIEAQIKLGEMYEEGKGVTQNYAKAAGWFRKAANQGNIEAQMHLAEMYEEGKGVTQNYVKAAEWYEEVAKRGNAKAKNKLDLLDVKIHLAKGDTIKYVLYCNYPGADFKKYIYESEIKSFVKDASFREELDYIINDRLQELDFEKIMGSFFTEDNVPASSYVCYDEVRADVFGNGGFPLNKDAKIYLDTVSKDGTIINTEEINIEDYVNLESKKEFLMECGLWEQTDEYIETALGKFVDISSWHFALRNGDQYYEDIKKWPAPTDDGTWVDKDGNTLKPCMWFGDDGGMWDLDGYNLDFWLSDCPENYVVEVHYDAYPNYGGGIPGFEEVVESCPIKIEADDTPESIDKKIQAFFVEQYHKAHF